MRACILLTSLIFAAGTARAQTAGREVFTFQDKAISESSGLAASQRYPVLLWTHNDSMNPAQAYLVDPQGQTVVTYNITGSENLDWEDIAIAGTGEDAWLYIGDIGDNFSIRGVLQIYRVREPKIDPDKTGQVADAKGVESMVLRYPDGARDAESLMATPSGLLYILSKAKDGKSHLYVTPEPYKADSEQVLKLVGEVDFPATGRGALATSAEFSPDGKRLAVVTYKQLYEWTLPVAFDCGKLGAIAPVTCALPPLPQCEGVCYSVDGTKIYVSSEKVNTPVWEFSSPLQPGAQDAK
jgi:WD40 repeat protein